MRLASTRVQRRPSSLMAVALCALLWQSAWGADHTLALTDKTVPPTPPARPAYNPPDCSRPSQDIRCRPATPDHRPYPYYRRPVIIDQTPPAPAIDPDTLSDDWEGCRTAKLNAMQTRDAGKMEQANRLDEWLWKNCRSYSEELRELEQDRM